MEIHVHDPSLIKVGMLEIFDSMIWNERFDEAGDFELHTIPTEQIVSLLQLGYVVSIPGTPKGMFIESREFKSRDNELIVKGRSLESVLDRRRVTNQTIFDNENMQTAILQLIDDAFISSSYLKRNVSNFVTVASTDPLITALTLKMQYRLDIIYDVVTNLCSKNNFGFRIDINDDEYEFKLYAGTDRSIEQTDNPLVLFSHGMENLLDSSYLETIKYSKNDTLVLAQLAPDEEKWAPVWLVVPNYPNEPGGLDKREMSSDAGHVDRYDNDTNLLIPWATYSVMLEEVGLKDLNSAKPVTIFDGTADSTIGPEYRKDYFLGDTVQFEDRYGNTGKAVIKEVTISEDQSGYSVYPILEKDE